jgi:hypothetical protein
VHPTPANPAYYLPIWTTFQEMGSVRANEKAPNQTIMLHLVAVALAGQGYRMMNPSPYSDEDGAVTFADGTKVHVPPEPSEDRPLISGRRGGVLTMKMIQAPEGPYSLKAAQKTPAAPNQPKPAILRILKTVDPVHGAIMRGTPTLLLMIHYGYMNPKEDDVDGSGRKVQLNQDMMLGLVAGNTFQNLTLDFERETVFQEAGKNRYFVILTAYDLAAYATSRKKIVLWQAKMSAPSAGIAEFADVGSALVTAGAPFFGRETLQPKMITLPVTPEGKVEIGPLTTKDYSEAPAATPPKPGK